MYNTVVIFCAFINKFTKYCHEGSLRQFMFVQLQILRWHSVQFFSIGGGCCHAKPLRILSPCIANLLIKHACSWPMLYVWRQHTSRQGHLLLCTTFFCTNLHINWEFKRISISSTPSSESQFNSLPSAMINMWVSIKESGAHVGE